MNKQEGDILNTLYLEPFINQRILAELFIRNCKSFTQGVGKSRIYRRSNQTD